MAVTLKALKGSDRTVPVTYNGETFDVAYRPGEFTGDLLANLSDVDESRADAAVKVMVSILLPVLSWWDVEDEQGQRLPITQQTLQAMPLAVLGAILQAVKVDNTPGEADAPSDAG